MKRAAGFVVFAALLGAAIAVGVLSRPSSDPVTYQLDEHASGRPIGNLRVNPGNEVCWELSLGRLPKAMQLHYDVTGPSDPVVASFYGPPGAPKPEGCTLVDQETTDLLAADQSVFYVDGHDTETDPPVIWATLD